MIEDDPKAAFSIFEEYGVPIEIGDPLIDRWEKEIAAGRAPDLAEGLSDSQKEHYKEFSIEAFRRALAGELETIGGGESLGRGPTKIPIKSVLKD